MISCQFRFPFTQNLICLSLGLMCKVKSFSFAQNLTFSQISLPIEINKFTRRTLAYMKTSYKAKTHAGSALFCLHMSRKRAALQIYRLTGVLQLLINSNVIFIHIHVRRKKLTSIWRNFAGLLSQNHLTACVAVNHSKFLIPGFVYC